MTLRTAKSTKKLSINVPDWILQSRLQKNVYLPGLTGTSAQQPDGLVDTSERRHIHSLTTNSTGTTNPGWIFPGSRVDDSVDQNLEWVLKKKIEVESKFALQAWIESFPIVPYSNIAQVYSFS